MRLNTISLHIPVYNEEAVIERCLFHVIKQDYDKTKWQCVIVDNNSTDATSRIVKRFIKKHADFNLVLVTEKQAS